MTFPPSVYAITIAKNGGPEVIEKTEVPFPTVNPDHLIIKSKYLGVNFRDTYIREGLYPVSQFPHVLGTEAGGEIVQLPTNPTILSDPDYQQRGFVRGGRAAFFSGGAYAEYVSVPWELAYPVPDDIPTISVAAGLAQGLTAISFMEEAYSVQRGDVILVHTIAGGLGLLFCQYAKSLGATVIGTTSTDEKAALAKQNGADHVINYKRENTVQRVLEITNGEGVHASFDGVGKDTFDSNFEMIRRKGTLVSVGNASGPVSPFAPLKLTEKNLTLLRPTVANYMHTPSEVSYYFNKFWTLLKNGTMTPHVHKVYPFSAEGVKDAQVDLTGGKTVGKLVIDVDLV